MAVTSPFCTNRSRINRRIAVKYLRFLNVLPEGQVKQIQASIKQINQLGLPPDETARSDLYFTYISQGLVNDSISTLEAQAEAGSQDSSLYLELGDLYLQAGFPKLAKLKYEKAIKLAKDNANSTELQIAEVKLQRLVYYQSQLPTRTKLDQ